MDRTGSSALFAKLGGFSSEILARGRRPLTILAALMFALSLVYIASFAVRNWHTIKQLPAPSPWFLLTASVLYLLAHPFTASAWVLGLRGLGQDIPFFAGIKIALATQVGKYLPGNVAHYLARAGLASIAGVTLARSGIATVLEILAALLAATLVASVATLIDPAPLAAAHAALTGQIAVPVALALGAIGSAVLFLHFARIPVRVLAKVTVCLAVNFILIGLSFLAVVGAVSGQSPSPAAMVGIFTIAWTAGFLVPGAPAGLGVREAVLLAWLSTLIGAGPALACTMLHRLITAAIDAVVGVASYSWLHSARPDPDLSKK